ncbi:hypothetical protein CDAR_577341 [Caerostris darwini]|uniref:Uncharacterized protein n=1 Tax=Caerostris darwini TaxID=1538125 RepID=A0AAV4N6G7_9ARAC|nr:hypothetical protein CDAR_577341 [Caerostris darwini]
MLAMKQLIIVSYQSSCHEATYSDDFNSSDACMPECLTLPHSGCYSIAPKFLANKLNETVYHSDDFKTLPNMLHEAAYYISLTYQMFANTYRSLHS